MSPLMPKRRPVNLWNQVAMFVTLVGVWVLLWDDLSVLSVVSGFVVAWIVTRVFYLPPVEFSNRVNPWRTVVFLVALVGEIVSASLRVAWQVLTLPREPVNAIIEVPLRSRSESVLVWTTEAVSLVPGSIVIEVDPKRNVMFLHVLGADRPDAIERACHSVLRTEARIVEAIGSREDVRRVRAEHVEEEVR